MDCSVTCDITKYVKDIHQKVQNQNKITLLIVWAKIMKLLYYFLYYCIILMHQSFLSH